MSPEEAINLLKQVGASFQGSLQDHNNIQAALRIVESVVLANKFPEPKPDKNAEK